MIVFTKNSTATIDRQAGQVALDDVGAALRGRREPHAAEAGVAAGMHEDQQHERRRQQHLQDDERCRARHQAAGYWPAAARTQHELVGDLSFVR